MIKSIFGGILIAFGALLLIGVFADFPKEPLTGADIIGAFFLGVLPIVGGGLFIHSHIKGKQKALQDAEKALRAKREKEVIQLAQQTNGRVSIPEIVAGTSMNTIEADQLMREMVEKGYVDMKVTDSGVIIYEFYEIAHRNKIEE